MLSKPRRAFWQWKTTPLDERIEIARRYAQEVEKAEDLPALISEEVGKPLWESKQEVAAMVGKVALSIEALQERTATKHKGQITIEYRPHGVLGVLSPFNFPGHLPNGHIVPALLAGNTVVLKPSEHTPRVGKRIGELWQAAGLPEGVLEVVTGSPEIGWELATHPDLSGILFTGSLQTGLKLSEYYGKHPDKILALEMGGNNPLIVAEVADVQKAVLTALQSAYLTTGQRCTSARRLILVDSPTADPFLDALMAALDKIRIGWPTDRPEPFMGPMITKQAAKRVIAFQQGLIEAGAAPLKPMTLYEERFLTPGILDTTHTRGPDEECFGPLLQLIRVPTLEAAANEANNTRFGLCGALLADRSENFSYVKERIRAGVFNWNCPTTGASSAAPFGGIGWSGNGRPSGYTTCDIVAYPMVSKEAPQLEPTLTPGLAYEA